MPLDPAAVGTTSQPQPVSWTPRDCCIYALGVGAGVDDLQFTTDNTGGVAQRVLPTMPVTLGQDVGIIKKAGDIDWARLLHAEQAVELYAELPPEGRAVSTTRIAEMWDKQKAALVVLETEARDPDDDRLLFRTRTALIINGAGGWGGERGPASSWTRPTRAPDRTISQATRPEQALLYRLSGDRNRLHSDPSFARKAGFDRPILHGLCTYGFSGRALLHALPSQDPGHLASMTARFAAPVLPGDTLHVDVWQVAESELLFETRRDDGTVVLSHGVATIRRQDPA